MTNGGNRAAGEMARALRAVRGAGHEGSGMTRSGVVVGRAVPPAGSIVMPSLSPAPGGVQGTQAHPLRTKSGSEATGLSVVPPARQAPRPVAVLASEISWYRLAPGRPVSTARPGATAVICRTAAAAALLPSAVAADRTTS